MADEALSLPNSRPPSTGLGLLNLLFSVSELSPRIIQRSDGTASGKVSPSAQHVFVQRYKDTVAFTLNLCTKGR